MLTRRTWRLRPTWIWLIVLGFPAIADAQLFPNLAIKRDRPECVEELPIYGLYRRQYHGYFPTCWRSFPPGWGCPTPERPNWTAEVARNPLQLPEGIGGEEDGGGLNGPATMEPDPFGGEAGGDERLPAVPQGGRSPFELDEPNGGAAPPADGRRPAGNDAPPPIDRETPPSPFDLPGGGANSNGLPSVNPPVSPASERTYIPMPDLPPPTFDQSVSSNGPTMVPPVDALPGALAPAPRVSVGRVSPGDRVVEGDVFSGGTPMEGVVLGGDGQPVGPVVLPDETYVEAPQARPQGRVRGLLSGLLYGRGLRR
jgi:hypothetical protein